jgi:hypothetical protein
MAYIVMWRSGVVMAIGDTRATDTVATDTVAMDIVATMVTLMEVITVGDIALTTGLITEAFMATHMAATTAGLMEEGSGLASVSKTEEECGSKRAGEETLIMSRLYF